MAVVVAATSSWSSLATAADLPDHDPIRVLVISDGVNPHGLSDAELTQPGEIGAALGNPGSGLSIDGAVVEVDSQCLDDAVGPLGDPGSFDVIIYFAHLAATACDGTPRQNELTSGFEAHLQAGGGIVVFHHGIYQADGKDAVLQLLGGVASSIAWDTGAGQDVIAIDQSHFVTSEGIDYSGMRTFDGAGVPAGEYPFFNNTPDETYESTQMLTASGETRTILFASAGPGGEAPRVIGYDLHRPGWMGHVVFYQPGEYQPAALDDLSGNGFQILANSVLYAATTQDDPGSTSGGEDTGEPPGDSGMADSSDDMGGSTGGSGTPTTATDSGVEQDGGGGGGDEGCGCTHRGPGDRSLWLMMLAGLAFVRRRR